MRSQFRLVPRICYRYVCALFYYFFIAKRQPAIYVKFPKTCRLGNQMFMTAFGESLKARTGLPVYYYTNFLAYYLKEIDPWIYRRFKVMTLTIPMGTVFEEKSLPNKNYDESIRNALQKGNVLIS